jgi:hypothetical protein
MSTLNDDEAIDPRKEVALRAFLLAIGVMVLAGFGLNAHLERHNAAASGAAKVSALFEGVDQDMLVRQDLMEISDFLTRELDQREVAILRLSNDVALSCEMTRDGDFTANFHDVMDNQVSPWTWPNETSRPAAIDALCGMMLSTVLAAQRG